MNEPMAQNQNFNPPNGNDDNLDTASPWYDLNLARGQDNMQNQGVLTGNHMQSHFTTFLTKIHRQTSTRVGENA